MPMVGDLLADRYEIQAVLGAGGMASVYRAMDLRLQREVAVKVLLPNLAADPIVASRFEREARALAGAAHPGIVAIFDVEPGDPGTGREPFYVMELCDGGSLADRLDAVSRLDPPQVVEVIAAVADGLAAMHAQSLIHRDVKPHNVLFCGDRPKLADFGLVRDEHPGAQLMRLTDDGTTLGTLPYLAPELLAGGAPSYASDVYSLGVTAFQALTGQLPRPLGSLRDMVESRTAAPAAASTVAKDLGSAFDAPLTAALATEAARRPAPQAFAVDLAAALEAWSPDASAGAAPAESEAKTAAFAVAALPPPPSPAQIAATETLVVPVAAADGPAPQPEPEPAPKPAAVVVPLSLPSFRMPRVDLDEQGRRGLVIAGAAIVGLAAFVLVAAVIGRALDTRAGPSASAAANATASASPGPSASASLDPAVAAVDDVIAAIDAARGGRDGLKGGEANNLAALAGQVRSALQSGNLDAAREAAAKLEEQAGKVSKGLDEKRRDRLLEAIQTLRDAIAGED